MSNRAGIIIIIILIAIIIIGGVGAFLYLRNNTASEPKEVEKFAMTTEDMYSNIKESNKIVKIRITVESTSEESIGRIKQKEFLVRDVTNKIIRNQKEEDLEGNDGQIRLQDAIKEELSEKFSNDIISDVYFDDFVIQ